MIYVAVPVRSGDDIHGAVRLTYPAHVVDDRVRKRLRGVLVVAAISIGAAVALALLLTGTVTRPLHRLRGATNALAAGDLSARAAGNAGPPEIRALAASFDTMAARLEHMVAMQRSFAADASHQLRTPLTALRLRIEQAAALAPSDPTAAARRLEAAAAEIDRLARVTDGLLVLARAEGSGSHVEEVDVAAVVRDRADQWRPLADERLVALEVQTPVSATALRLAGGCRTGRRWLHRQRAGGLTIGIDVACAGRAGRAVDRAPRR